MNRIKSVKDLQKLPSGNFLNVKVWTDTITAAA